MSKTTNTQKILSILTACIVACTMAWVLPKESYAKTKKYTIVAVELKKNILAYNGGKVKPKIKQVLAQDSKGNVYKLNSKNYKVDYNAWSTKNYAKHCGEYELKVKGKNTAKGSASAYYNVDVFAPAENSSKAYSKLKCSVVKKLQNGKAKYKFTFYRIPGEDHVLFIEDLNTGKTVYEKAKFSMGKKKEVYLKLNRKHSYSMGIQTWCRVYNIDGSRAKDSQGKAWTVDATCADYGPSK